MIFLIGPRHSSGAHDSRPPLEWCGPMKVFFQGGRVAGVVDSWPETLVPSASNRSTPEWTLVDSPPRATKRDFGPGSLDRHAGAADLDAAHQAAERAGVAERDVLGAAIVPEGDRALLPAEAKGEFRPVTVLQKK